MGEKCSAENERRILYILVHSVTFLPREYLGDTAVADPELPGDVARPHSVVRQLDDPLPDDVGQRPPVDEDATQLVHAAVT